MCLYILSSILWCLFIWFLKHVSQTGGFYLCLWNQCLSPLNLWLNATHGEVYSIQHYVIKFVIDLRQVGGFLQFPRHNDISEILLKVALNTINLTHITIKVSLIPCTWRYVLDTTICNNVCQWNVAGRLFSVPVSDMRQVGYFLYMSMIFSRSVVFVLRFPP